MEIKRKAIFSFVFLSFFRTFAAGKTGRYVLRSAWPLASE
jgi:hypothetical protein